MQGSAGEVDSYVAYMPTTTHSAQTLKQLFAFIIHPNPAKTEIFISGDNLANATYQVVTIEGKPLQTGILSNGMISIQNLEGGMYILKIKTQSVESIQRFVKE
jgi:hypothetical protein